jgi:uncharacterized membrane protein (DUF4010 family)
LENLEILRRLGVALAIGLLMGLERGWEQRDLAEGQRFAGFRTFGIVSLFGGIVAVVGTNSPVMLAAGFVAIGLLVAAGYWRSTLESESVGATTAAATLLAFALGALAGQGQLAMAASAAVVVTFLLGFKPELHAIVQRIERPELLATLRLLLISIVLLPVLPDRGYGPWEVLNPYHLWWMVVAISGLSYIGYFAIKLMGNRLGMLVTGLLGGLVSSTATAFDLAPQAKKMPQFEGMLADAIVIASAVMFPRMLVIAAVNPPLMIPLAAPLLTAGVVALAIGMLALRRSQDKKDSRNSPMLRTKNPLDLWFAIRFGLLLSAILLMARAGVAIAGDRGIYAVSALSAIADVDAITLSLATMSAHNQTSPESAIIGMLIAATVNSMVKPAVAGFFASAGMAWRIAWPLLLAIAAGATAFAVSTSWAV